MSSPPLRPSGRARRCCLMAEPVEAKAAVEAAAKAVDVLLSAMAEGGRRKAAVGVLVRVGGRWILRRGRIGKAWMLWSQRRRGGFILMQAGECKCLRCARLAGWWMEAGKTSWRTVYMYGEVATEGGLLRVVTGQAARFSADGTTSGQFAGYGAAGLAIIIITCL